jgi:argininosuccinate synthase
MEEKKKKVVVAFSGGLDTSFTVMYLAKEKGYEVYAACANTGGFSEEQLKQNEENAYKLGAVKYVTLDVTREYYEKSLKYMVFGNVLRNGTYPISVSSERIFQGLAIARYANEIGADAIAHGSTGAGNDQIRFDMTFLVLAPAAEHLASKGIKVIHAGIKHFGSGVAKKCWGSFDILPLRAAFERK